MGHLLIIGYGDLGIRVAKLLGNFFTISVVKRSAVSKNGTKVNAYQGDASNSEFMLHCLRQTRPDYILITLTPDEYSVAAYQRVWVETVRNICDQLQEANLYVHIIFVSSTSVYGQNNAEIVNEASLANPKNFNGQLILSAEQCIKNSGFKHSIIRFSGLYKTLSPRVLDRVDYLMKINHQNVNQNEQAKAWAGIWSNRIHREDAARYICHLIKKITYSKPVKTLYLATDSEPILLYQYYCFIAKVLYNATLPNMDTTDFSGKRCDNSQILADGFLLNYPNYRIYLSAHISQ